MRRLSIVLIAGAVAVSACSDLPVRESDADGPIADVFRLRGADPPLRTLDATFADIAGRIPGFGGLYFDERGVATVYMAPVPGAPTLSADALASQLNARLRERGLEGNLTAQDLVIRAGDYDFRQLDRFHREVMPVLSIPGVVFTDADETLNRIVIGVEEGTAEQLIRDAVQQLGVPLAAVSIVLTDPIVPLQAVATELAPLTMASNIGGNPTLRDEIRPIAGGLQIWRQVSPTSLSICTLGFNAAAPSVSQGRLMFTNSHCTAVRGQVTGTEYNQKQVAFPIELDVVAVEVEDPPFFTNATNSACPANLPGFAARVCRYSDAAAAEYLVPNAAVAMGRVMAPFPGTLVIPGSLRTFRIVEEATARSMVGQGLMKVGRTSGLTGAAVVATCQTTNTLGAGNVLITLLCQERVAIDAIGGDSGSPVIEALDQRGFMDVSPNQRVRLHGLLWGGSANTYVYSSMLNIRMEFPGPWTVVN
jgi:hypothetical protein